MSKVKACSQRVHFEVEDWIDINTHILTSAAEVVWEQHNLEGTPAVFGTNNDTRRILIVWGGEIPNNVRDLVEEFVDVAYEEITKGT